MARGSPTVASTVLMPLGSGRPKRIATLYKAKPFSIKGAAAGSASGIRAIGRCANFQRLNPFEDTYDVGLVGGGSRPVGLF